MYTKYGDRDSDSMRARRYYSAKRSALSVGLGKNRREHRYDKDHEQRNNTESDISFQEITSQTQLDMGQRSDVILYKTIAFGDRLGDEDLTLVAVA